MFHFHFNLCVLISSICSEPNHVRDSANADRKYVQSPSGELETSILRSFPLTLFWKWVLQTGETVWKSESSSSTKTVWASNSKHVLFFAEHYKGSTCKMYGFYCYSLGVMTSVKIWSFWQLCLPRPAAPITLLQHWQEMMGYIAWGHLAVLNPFSWAVSFTGA